MSATGSNVPPPNPVPPADPKLSAKRQLKKKNTQDFWRATRFLLPYRQLVIASIISALLVGVAMAGGFTAMIPILRVLINGDTVPNWVNRQVVQKRLQVEFIADAPDLRVNRVKSEGPAAAAGIVAGEALAPLGGSTDTTQMLSQLSNPALSS